MPRQGSCHILLPSFLGEGDSAFLQHTASDSHLGICCCMECVVEVSWLDISLLWETFCPVCSMTHKTGIMMMHYCSLAGQRECQAEGWDWRHLGTGLLPSCKGRWVGTHILVARVLLSSHEGLLPFYRIAAFLPDVEMSCSQEHNSGLHNTSWVCCQHTVLSPVCDSGMSGGIFDSFLVCGQVLAWRKFFRKQGQSRCWRQIRQQGMPAPDLTREQLLTERQIICHQHSRITQPACLDEHV